MCGIFGIVGKNIIDNELIEKFHSIQSHRGPDGKGSWQGKVGRWNIALGHQRLAILDLTESGNQPMSYMGGDCRLVFNGEIYNYLELKNELQVCGCDFTTNTDTEVILASFCTWGVERALKKFNGMWALAYLDVSRARLYLSRDRTGEKPLYITQREGNYYFSSEVKTILKLVNKKFRLNYQTIGLFLKQALLDSTEETFFEGIRSIPAAAIIEIDLRKEKVEEKCLRYWEPTLTSEPISYGESQQRLYDLLEDSVRIRTRSDVPVGILLSGGIDSCSIAALAKKNNNFGHDITLLSAVSSDKRFDESGYIDIATSHLGVKTEKVTLDIRPGDLLEKMKTAVWHNDAPIGSLANIAHYELMQKAKELGVTVILSGQGADELLCGYKKYVGFYIQSLVKNAHYGKAISTIFSFLKNKSIINQFNLAEAKRYLPAIRKKDSIFGENIIDTEMQYLSITKDMTMSERQYRDLAMFSVPALNHYEDRMSMASSREIRLPFLDYRVIDFLLPLSMDHKINNGWTKYILRKSMDKLLPKEITERRDKQGFVNPQSEWMKHELKETILGLFSDDCMISRLDIIKRNELLKLYSKYCKQKPNKGTIWFRDIFSPLSLEVWLKEYSEYIH